MFVYVLMHPRQHAHTTMRTLMYTPVDEREQDYIALSNCYDLAMVLIFTPTNGKLRP